ncbi:Amyloid-beta A4 precursor protein-binding family A member 1 [Merluccius polli]|uniref:Amyloid-beta A4 precursor protein-binding family A member 3 n=1 Tax=Merluccius polli TaxID=89951 RepID=A0AA47MS67_MERPO|nr:Amyloid-beta A4 precursor protein-binding family A member 1 [Merluccius polli]
MESDGCTATPPGCPAPGRLCTGAGSPAGSPECVSQDPLGSFNLMEEPPPLDWRSDTSSEAGSMEDMDEAEAFPSSAGEERGVKAEVEDGRPVLRLVPPLDAGDAAAPPSMGVRREGEKVDELGVDEDEAEVFGRLTTEEEVVEDDVLQGVVDEEEKVNQEEEDEVGQAPDRTPGDEDHTRVHALLNRLQRMGEEPGPDRNASTSDLEPYAHTRHHPFDTGPQEPSGTCLLTDVDAETTGLLFSESHQRDLLGLLECTEIAATPAHSHYHQHSPSPRREDVDAVVSVSYSQDEAQEFWRHYRNNWQLPPREGSYTAPLPDDQLSEPVWMKREPEEEEEEEQASGADEESEDYRPAYKDVPGPCDPEDLIDGIIFGAKYLGSTQIRSDKNLSTNARMIQAQEAVDRIKAPEGESQPMVEVDLFISTQRIKVLNADTQEAMMDHSLQMISYIADISNIVVLMARRKPPSPKGSTGNGTASSSSTSSSATGALKKCSMVCHVFSSEDAQTIAQAIGQAFGVAYQQFLQASGIKASQLRPGDYSDFLGTQELYNGDLAHFSDSQNIRDVLISKGPGEILGLAVVESGWGSILPTVVVANLLHGGPAERSGALSIGDRIMSVNGTSLVGLPIASCQNIIRDLKNQTIVKLSIVHCPPVTMAIIKRPDPKFQLGFSVEDGIICSLMRGGIAERGGIRVGHRIIEINGQSVVATPHEKIIGILTNAVGEIHLKTMPASTYRLLTGQEQPLFL